MRTLRVEVDGLPPKKDGANSMWRKRPEVPRIVKLRLAAAGVLGTEAAFDGALRLELVVHVPVNGRHVGDLDNMITGVLDALQRVAPGTPWASEPAWEGAEAVRPDAWHALVDDVHVVEIAARKSIGSGPRYELTLTELG